MQEKVEACEDLDMMSPYKEKKHLKWCLLDEAVKVSGSSRLLFLDDDE